MIDPKELRIGNHVCCEGMEISIDAISKEKIRFKNTKGTFYVDPENLQSIPLTPEILEKCGFLINPELGLTSDRKERVVYEFDEMRISFEDGSSFVWNEGTEDSFLSSAYPEIKYLHQLQNKYYFDKLTGEELEIKELQHT